MQAREIALAEVQKNAEEYAASQNSKAEAPAPAPVKVNKKSNFDF